MKRHTISIIGTGYVGLSTALGFTSKGYTVITSDPDKEQRALFFNQTTFVNSVK